MSCSNVGRQPDDGVSDLDPLSVQAEELVPLMGPLELYDGPLVLVGFPEHGHDTFPFCHGLHNYVRPRSGHNLGDEDFLEFPVEIVEGHDLASRWPNVLLSSPLLGKRDRALDWAQLGVVAEGDAVAASWRFFEVLHALVPARVGGVIPGHVCVPGGI